MKIQRAFWGAWYAFCHKFWPARLSTGAVPLLSTGGEEAARNKNWDASGEGERWYCGSCVVLPEWQKRGLAKKMFRAGLALAEAEGVSVVLESSTAGEALYRSLGFVRVALFGKEYLRGGLMIWLPSWRKAETSGWECKEDGGEGTRFKKVAETWEAPAPPKVTTLEE